MIVRVIGLFMLFVFFVGAAPARVVIRDKTGSIISFPAVGKFYDYWNNAVEQAIQTYVDLRAKYQDEEAVATITGLKTFSTNPNFSLTPCSVTFSGASGLLSQDNANLCWDNTNKRLGLGTNTPLATLDIRGKLALGTVAPVGAAWMNIENDASVGSNTYWRAKDTGSSGIDVIFINRVGNSPGYVSLWDNTNLRDILSYQSSLSRVTLGYSGSTAYFPGQIQSIVTTGTAPLIIASTTEVANLRSENSGLLLGSSWASPQAIGNTTPAAGTFTTLSVNTGVSNDTGGIKHQSVTTGSVSGGASVAVTLTWSTAFADTNYRPICSLVEATTSTSTIRIHHVESFTASAVVVRIVNDDGSNAKTGSLVCFGFHG